MSRPIRSRSPKARSIRPCNAAGHGAARPRARPATWPRRRASALPSPPSSRCRSTRVAANTRPSGRPRRRSASAGSISTPRATRCRRPSTQAWGQLEAAKAQIEATQAQVAAAEIALNGVREEARVGQRTTLDVLNAQQDLVNARVSLVTAQRDRVVASYTVLAAVGSLSPQILGARRPDLRSDGALSAGPRQLGRRAHAGRTISLASSIATSNLRSTFDMPYCCGADARSVGGTDVCVRGRSHHWMSALSGPIRPKPRYASTLIRAESKVRLRAWGPERGSGK